MVAENGEDLLAGFFGEGEGWRDARADWEELECDDAGAGGAIQVLEFLEEGEVGVEADADAVDEEDGELRARAVRKVPVG